MSRTHRCLFLSAICGLALAPLTALAEDPAHSYFTDVVLIDQNGGEQHLYSDLLAGRVVIINTFFTECADVCPIIMGNLLSIQKHLGARLGDDVAILSLTADRENDTPERLLEYGQTLGVRPGWSLLTGGPENLDFARHKLGLLSASRDDHTNIVLVGNVPTGLWKKALGLAKSEDLIEIVDSVLQDELAGEADTEPER